MPSISPQSPVAWVRSADLSTRPGRRWLTAGWVSICVELVLLAAAVPLIRSAHGEYVANATDETGEAALEENIAFMVLALVVLFAILGVIALFSLLIGVLVRGNSRTTRVLIGCGVAIAVVEVAIAVTVGVLYFNVP